MPCWWDGFKDWVFLGNIEIFWYDVILFWDSGYIIPLYHPIHFVPAEPLFRHSMTLFKIMRWFWHISFTIKGIFSLRTLIYSFQPFQHIVISLIISGYYGFSSKKQPLRYENCYTKLDKLSEKLLKFYRFLSLIPAST